MVWLWHPDPFGNGDPTGAFSYDLRFPGQFFDQATRLHYNYFRDYDPRTGRYIESDPIGLAGGINTYAYAGGNPVNLADPLGLAKTDRWYGFTNRDFQWWFHNCYKQKGDPDVDSREDMAAAYAEYEAAGSPPRGKCSNNPQCPPENPVDEFLDQRGFTFVRPSKFGPRVLTEDLHYDARGARRLGPKQE